MIHLQLLGVQRLDVPKFLAAAHKALGRSLSAQLDKRKMDVTTPPAWLCMLAEMKKPGISIDAVLQNPGLVARHSFFSFMAATSYEVFTEIVEELPLRTTWVGTTSPQLDLGVISGTLEEFFTAIVSACSEVSSLRPFGNAAIIEFEKIGLGKLWAKYNKIPCKDGTFKLLERK